MMMNSPATSVDYENNIVPWTVADIFRDNDTLFLLYHSMGTSWDLGTLIGTMLGILVFAIRWSLRNPEKDYENKVPSLWYHVAHYSLLTGGLGLLGGFLWFLHKASCPNTVLIPTTSANNDPPLPWNDVARRNRVYRLVRNTTVRLLDKNVWAGMAIAGAVVIVFGHPSQMIGLSKGFLGVLQFLALGSTVGSAVALAQAVYVRVYGLELNKPDIDNASVSLTGPSNYRRPGRVDPIGIV